MSDNNNNNNNNSANADYLNCLVQAIKLKGDNASAYRLAYEMVFVMENMDMPIDSLYLMGFELIDGEIEYHISEVQLTDD